jgi:hypothetical protein
MQYLFKTISLQSICFLSILMGISINSDAQTTPTEAEVVKTKKNYLAVNNQYQKPSKDYIMIQLGFNSWSQPTTTNAKLSQRGHEIAMYGCYDFPFNKSNFSFALGAGIGSSNVYLNDQILRMDTTFAIFRDVKADSIKRYKLSTNYLEFPIEFRYFANKTNRNRGFKASVGTRLGTLINAHTKAFVQQQAGNLREKESSRRFFETWRIMPVARIGYGNFSVHGAIQVNELFRPTQTNGVGNRPYSIGLTISGM